MADTEIQCLGRAAVVHPRITTPEQLHSPDWLMGTVIQEIHTGDCCEEPHCDFYPPLWEFAFSCGWSRAGKLYDPNDDTPRLPARLLWHPERDR